MFGCASRVMALRSPGNSMRSGVHGGYSRFSWPLKASRSSSAKKGLIRTEIPCAEIESTVCDLVSPVITVAGTFQPRAARRCLMVSIPSGEPRRRSEEHTSELQSPDHLVCRLLLEKKKQMHCKHKLISVQSRAPLPNGP